MLKIRPESLTPDELLRMADHEVACGNYLPLDWQKALVQQIFKLRDALDAHA